MIDPRQAFEKIVATQDGMMSVVTAHADDGAAGCLVGFSTQCSIDPVRFVVCLSHANCTYRVARRAQFLVVHALDDSDLGRDLARLFGETTGDDQDKFAECHWHEGPDATPVLEGCDWFAGHILMTADVGDHTMFVLDIVEGALGPAEPGRRLGYQASRHLEAAHPAGGPT